MKTAAKAETVVFSTRGQVVIPRRLRREYGIEDGTKARVYETADGILLKPVTAKHIRGIHGKYRHLPLMETLAEIKREERGH